MIVTTNPGGSETGLIQTMVAAAVCSAPGRDIVTSGAGTVSAFGGALQTPA